MSAIDLCAVLKQETIAQHRQIEQVPMMQNMVGGCINLQEYSCLLQGFLSFYAPLERKIAHFLQQNNITPPANREYSYIEKGILLENDIKVLASLLPAMPLVPEYPTTLDINHWADFLGVLYVIEGSTLGGKLIRERLSQYLGQDVIQATSFFDCYGKDCKIQWLQTVAFINKTAIERQIGYQEAINSAQKLFTELGHCLSQKFLIAA
ncbi:MAG: biliverdin-producing heme oxygenase [Alphaproteobacteria bacterium]